MTLEILWAHPTYGQARAKQVAPPGQWDRWVIRAGRGWGKTRTGAEWVRDKALTHPGCRIAVVARTFSDARDVCIEGESGLVAVCGGAVPGPVISLWNRSLGEFVFVNGSRVKLFTAEKPASLRGPQHHFAWCDELASWDYPEAWDQLNFGLRLGEHPQTIVTTTPRPTAFVRRVLALPQTIETMGSTYENAENLAGPALAQLEATYGGTRLGRQELYGEMLEDVEGALWARSQLEDCYLAEAPVGMKRIVVGVDPAGGAAETGIVVCGLGSDAKGYVLADLSVATSPGEWGRIVVEAAHGWGADRVVVERNFGGDMAEHTIRTADRNIPVKTVTASHGKIPRAEPIAALYEQHRVHHVGRFPKLEDQMCTYTRDDKVSPDRMDALVWALTELMVEGRFVNKHVSPGSLTRQSVWRAE